MGVVSVPHPFSPPQEVFGFLVSFNKHDEWMTTSIPWQPPPGSVFMFNRQKVSVHTSRWG